MKVRNCSIGILRRHIKKGKRLLCFGAGGRLTELLDGYIGDELEKTVQYVFDNDKNKWGTYKEINGVQIPIVAPEKLKEIYDKDHIILITMTDYRAIAKQIEDVLGNNVVCYMTPVIGLDSVFFFNVYSRIVEYLTKKMPISNTIFFCGWGKSQRENEAALRDYLIRNGYGKKYKIVWQREDEGRRDVDYITIPRRFLDTYTTYKEIFKCYYVRNTAKYIFFENHILRKVRDNQKAIYLNHGEPPIKAMKGVINLNADVDVCVCTSEGISDIVSEQYNVSKEKLVYCGSPRFEHLFESERYIDKFVDKDQYDKIVMWMPTYRQHNLVVTMVHSNKIYPYGIPIFQCDEDFEHLNEQLKMLNICMLIKPHPLQNLDYIKVKNLSNIKLIIQEQMDSEDVGINSIIKDVDALITDYSTIAFDYMLLDRPIGYTIDDLEDYSLGFSVENPLDWMPGAKVSNMEELFAFLEDISKEKDDYREKRNEVRDIVHGKIELNNCEKLVEMLIIKN